PALRCIEVWQPKSLCYPLQSQLSEHPRQASNDLNPVTFQFIDQTTNERGSCAASCSKVPPMHRRLSIQVFGRLLVCWNSRQIDTSCSRLLPAGLRRRELPKNGTYTTIEGSLVPRKNA